MLYILYRGNHPELQYQEGQAPIVHLQADLQATIQWAAKKRVRWAFSDRNAGVHPHVVAYARTFPAAFLGFSNYGGTEIRSGARSGARDGLRTY